MTKNVKIFIGYFFREYGGMAVLSLIYFRLIWMINRPDYLLTTFIGLGLLLAFCLTDGLLRLMKRSALCNILTRGQYRRAFLGGIVVAISWSVFWVFSEDIYISLLPPNPEGHWIYPGASGMGFGGGINYWRPNLRVSLIILTASGLANLMSPAIYNWRENRASPKP